MAILQMQHVTMQIAALQCFEGNPRRGVVQDIVESLEANGLYRPVVVNAGALTGRPNEILCGNHTMLAARQLGWQEIAVTLVDVDEQAARKIVAADNRLADLGDYDPEALYALLDGLTDLTGSGYDSAFLDDLYRGLYPEPPLTDPDDAPPIPEEPVSQVGQIWELGPHRLLVGSCTDLAAVQRLVADTPPDVCWTDPPYGISYTGKTKQALTIKNDGAGGLAQLLNAAFAVLATACRPGAPVYVAHADAERVTFETSMRGSGLLVRQNLIWVKNTMVLMRSDFHYRHEPILYAFTPGGTGRLGRGGVHWYGDNAQTTVFEFDKPSRSTDHPTMKPVALIDAMLANSCPPGGTVYDPFAGSGSTLIAAHSRGARALCVELDPCYADVILRRFEEHTGTAPVLKEPNTVARPSPATSSMAWNRTPSGTPPSSK
jgi:DNA modification methylase